MAKYGLFGGNMKEPMQVVEGTSMVQSGEYVYIYRQASPNQGHGPQVGAIHLAPGQVVKEISK